MKYEVEFLHPEFNYYVTWVRGLDEKHLAAEMLALKHLGLQARALPDPLEMEVL